MDLVRQMIGFHSVWLAQLPRHKIKKKKKIFPIVYDINIDHMLPVPLVL